MALRAMTLVLLIGLGLPARAGVPDVMATAYPDPQERLATARAAAKDGGAMERWALAEALIACHRFTESDETFRQAARLATADEELPLEDLNRLAVRLEQRLLRDAAIPVIERSIERELALVSGAEVPTRADREHMAAAIDDLKWIATLHRQALRWDAFFATRERVLDLTTEGQRASELAEYLELLLEMDQTARALDVARQYADLSGDVEVLRRCIEVMVRERQGAEAQRMLRLAVQSTMEYWDFRYLLVQYMEAFDPGVRWATDRDARLEKLLMGRPVESVDYLLLGAAYQVVGDRELEEQAYRSYLNHGGVTPEKLRTAGDLLYGMGRTAEAFLLYQRFLAEYPASDLEPGVLLRVVDCLQRTYHLETSFHSAFNAFGYLFLDERTPQLPVGVFSVLYNDVPLEERLEGLEDALDRYYVDLLAVDLLWNLTRRHPDSPEAPAAYRSLLDYYRRYDDPARQLEVCDLFIGRYGELAEANEFRFEKASIHHGRKEYGLEEDAYRDVYEDTFPPTGAPRPFEPTSVEEQARALQHERAFRSLLGIYDRDRIARFYDEVALYKVEIDLRAGDMALVEELVRVCDEQDAYGEIESVYQEVIRSYETMSAYDKLARHYLRMRRTKEAEKVYQTARKRFRDRSEPYAWLHGYYKDEQQYERAEKVLRGAIDAFPEDLDWYFMLSSLSYSRAGEAGRCAVYEEALAHFPHEWRFVEGLVDCTPALEDKLILLEREQAVVNGARREMLSLYGEHYLFVDRVGQAQYALERSPDDPVLHRYAGDLYHSLSHFEQALEHYQRAAEVMTDDANLLKRVGDLQRSFGQYDEAAVTFEKVAQMRRQAWSSGAPPLAAPRGTAVHTRGHSVVRAADRSYWVTLGEVRAEGGDGAGAVLAWRHVIDQDRSSPDNWLEVASACWDYFLFDQAVAVFEEEREVLGDPHLHAKQLAAVYESKRDYKRAIREYVTILEEGDPMVREDVRIRLVYLSRHKNLGRTIRRSFERAIKSRPDHEGLYRNYADHAARIEDWPAVYRIYDDARNNVRDRRFLEWVAGEFERLEQYEMAEEAFADLAHTYATDGAAWQAYLDYAAPPAGGSGGDEARLAILIEAHWAMPTAGFYGQLIPMLEARGDKGTVDRALRIRADAFEGAERFVALEELALSRARRDDVDAAEDALREGLALGLTLADHGATWPLLDDVLEELLARDADEAAQRWLVDLERDLALEHRTLEPWVAIARAWHGAGRGGVAGQQLARIQQAAPYRVDVARMRGEALLAAGDEAGMVQMYEDAAKGVKAIADVDPAIESWRSVTLSPLIQVPPGRYGFLGLELQPQIPDYGYNPFGEVLEGGDPGWASGYYHTGYGYGDYGYGDYGYGDYGYGDYGYGYGYDYGEHWGEDPATRGKRVRKEMRRDLRRALVETVIPRGMKYDGVTAYQRMINEDPLDAELLLEGWRYAALNGYGDSFKAYYVDVQREAARDFRWYRLLSRLSGFEGDRDAEASWLEKMLEVEPHRADVHGELATMYRQLGKDAEALEHLDRQRFLTADESTYHRRAAALAFDAGQREEGRRHLWQVQRAQPHDATLLIEVMDAFAARGELEDAAGVARAFLDDPEMQVLARAGDRERLYRALVDVHLRGGDVSRARRVWWEAFGGMGITLSPQFRAIYTAPGMRGTLVKDFESHQEEIITDSALAARFRDLFGSEHLYREEAALRTLQMEAGLLDDARRVARTYGSDRADRAGKVDPAVRRGLKALQGDDYRSVYLDVAQRPSRTSAGSLAAGHARTIRLLLEWELSLYDQIPEAGALVQQHGAVSNHEDVRRYAREYDSGHRALSQYYASRHLFLDAAAELRQIELLFGPLYNDVYQEQLRLLTQQTNAGVEAEAAGRERARILQVARDAAVAEMRAWPEARIQDHVKDPFRDCALYRYLRFTAGAGDDQAFVAAYQAALDRYGVEGPHRAGTQLEARDIVVQRLLVHGNRLSNYGSLELAGSIHLRAIEIMPDEVKLQRFYLDFLASRAEQEQVMAAVEERIGATGRLWVYRWGIGYLAGVDDLPAALALSERCMETYGGDLDSRLAQIELLAQLGENERAAAEARFLVGNQTVGSYLQGAQIYASASFDAPPDQSRTAMANHSVHALGSNERERLFEVWAIGTGDAAALAYLIERHPRNATAYERMSRAAMMGGHHELAQQTVAHAVRLYPEDPSRYLGLTGEIHWAAGDEARARAAWKKLAREPYAEAVQQAFALLWDRDQHAEAVQLAAAEVVRRRGFDAGGGGQGSSIVAHAVGRIEESREYDLLGALYRGVAPVLEDPGTVANYTAHLRAVHRDQTAEEFLHDVLAGLEENQRHSVLYSLAAMARAEERYTREAQLLEQLVEVQPEVMSWRAMLVRARLDAGGEGAVDATVDALADNRTTLALRDPSLAPKLLLQLTRSDLQLTPADADRLTVALGDERYGETREGRLAPLAELELAAGRTEGAMEILAEMLDPNPSARELWAASYLLAEHRGAGEAACSLRGKQADHLLAYLPVDPEALILEARAAHCEGRLEDGIRIAGMAQQHNPGRADVVLERARFLLELGRPRDSLAVLDEALSSPSADMETRLLAVLAALDAGDPSASERFVELYDGTLADRRDGVVDTVAAASWAAREDDPRRAEAMAPALGELGRLRSDDPRPDRLAAALYRGLNRPGAGEPLLRRALGKAPNDPRSQVHLLDLLLAPEDPDARRVEEARARLEELYHLDPGSCDAGRLAFRVHVAEERPDAWRLAAGIAAMSCAGIPDLLWAETALVDEERYPDAITTLDRLMEVDPDSGPAYRERKERYIQAHEDAARKGVER